MSCLSCNINATRFMINFDTMGKLATSWPTFLALGSIFFCCTKVPCMTFATELTKTMFGLFEKDSTLNCNHILHWTVLMVPINFWFGKWPSAIPHQELAFQVTSQNCAKIASFKGSRLAHNTWWQLFLRNICLKSTDFLLFPIISLYARSPSYFPRDLLNEIRSWIFYPNKSKSGRSRPNRLAYFENWLQKWLGIDLHQICFPSK